LDVRSVYMCVHECVYMCMFICMYMYICVSGVYVCKYMYIHARVGVHMHSCRRILFICTVKSLDYMRMYHWCFLNTCMRGWGGVFVQLVHG